ncbi:hypothetical protein NADFUDRAFT_14731, partial [Nadsonia fulvescens var. elongata DSM 6958]
MSIEINWEKLFSPGNNGADGETNIHTNINEQIREFLDKQFQQINLPSYIQSVYITTFDLGTVPPEVEIKNITDPFPEFYSDDEESGNEGNDDDDNSSNYDHNINSLHKNDEEYNSEETDNEEGFTLPRDDDVQFLLKVAYNGDIKLGITATLLINYPSPSFISLPINLTITGLEINTMAVVAYVNPRKMYFSFICDVNDEGDAVTRKHGYNSGRSERVEIIKDMKIESEIANNGSVLRNVGMVERFVLEKVRGIIRDEVAWPGWIALEF